MTLLRATSRLRTPQLAIRLVLEVCWMLFGIAPDGIPGSLLQLLNHDVGIPLTTYAWVCLFRFVIRCVILVLCCTPRFSLTRMCMYLQLIGATRADATGNWTHPKKGNPEFLATIDTRQLLEWFPRPNDGTVTIGSSFFGVACYGDVRLID